MEALTKSKTPKPMKKRYLSLIGAGLGVVALCAGKCATDHLGCGVPPLGDTAGIGPIDIDDIEPVSTQPSTTTEITEPSEDTAQTGETEFESLEQATDLIRGQVTTAIEILKGYKYGDPEVNCDGPDLETLTFSAGGDVQYPQGAHVENNVEMNWDASPETEKQLRWTLETQKDDHTPVTETTVLADFNSDVACGANKNGVPATITHTVEGEDISTAQESTFCIEDVVEEEEPFFDGLGDVRDRIFYASNWTDLDSRHLELCAPPAEYAKLDQPWAEELMRIEYEIGQNGGLRMDEWDKVVGERMEAAGYGDEYRVEKARQKAEAEANMPEPMTEEEEEALIEEIEAAMERLEAELNAAGVE